MRCTATTAQGTRCKRTTCKYSPFCASHKAHYAAQSTIPNSGRGIFAAKKRRRNQTIGDYTKAVIIKRSEDAFMLAHPDGIDTHTARIGRHYYTAYGTGVRTHNQIGMANTARGGTRNNAKLLGSGRGAASQNIPKTEKFYLLMVGRSKSKIENLLSKI